MIGELVDFVTAPVRAGIRAVAGPKHIKVGVVGAAGGIGQPLSMLLKISPYVSELSLFDVAPFTPGAYDSDDASRVAANSQQLPHAFSE